MKIKSLFFAAFLLIGFSSQGYGQLLNGDFSQGGNHWDWLRANVTGSYYPICEDYLSSVNWAYNIDVVNGGANHGWVANGHNDNGWTQGVRAVCGAIRQQIQVPPGTRLGFDYQLGSVAYDNTSSHEVRLSADILHGQGRTKLIERVGKNKTSHECNNLGNCPRWRSITADVSQFWGQNVTLQFFSRSRYWRNGFGELVEYSSPAYIDNIQFEPIPPVSTFPISGLWYNPNRSGHGIDISRSSTGQYQVVWFTYLPSGTPIWYMSSLQSMTQGAWNATLNKVTRDPVSGSIVQQPVGTAKITMLANNELIYEWDLNAQSGSPSTGAERMVHLHGGGAYSGMWYEPAFSGWGFTLDVEGSGSGATTVATAYFYTASGEPVWAQGVASGDLNQQVTFSMDTFVGSGLCPGCAGQPTSATPSPAGTLHMRQLGSSPKGYSNIQTAGGVTWVRGSSSNLVTYARLTVP